MQILTHRLCLCNIEAVDFLTKIKINITYFNFLEQARARAPGPIWHATLKDKGSTIIS